jgi:hypothetical protein
LKAILSNARARVVGLANVETGTPSDCGDGGHDSAGWLFVLWGVSAMVDVRIEGIYLSPGHNYFGHSGKPPGTHPTVAVEEVECVAGKGLVGDRFFDFKPERFPNGYNGQVTFFAIETHEELCAQLGVWDREPWVYRRNIVTRGVDLNEWIDVEFEIQGVRFQGMKEAAPCEWMNVAFGPGALKALTGLGGLRARVLSGGVLRVSDG